MFDQSARQYLKHQPIELVYDRISATAGKGHGLGLLSMEANGGFGSIAADHHSRRVHERSLTDLCRRPLTQFRTKRGMWHEAPARRSLPLVAESVDMIVGAINTHPEAGGCRLIESKPFGSYALNMGCL